MTAYENGRCWYGDPTVAPGHKQFSHVGLCNKEGSPLYNVGKGELGLGSCRMYLCNYHVKSLQKRGFSLTKVVE